MTVFTHIFDTLYLKLLMLHTVKLQNHSYCHRVWKIYSTSKTLLAFKVEKELDN